MNRRKFIVMMASVALLIISASTYLYIINRAGEDFPHYKQYIYPHNGAFTFLKLDARYNYPVNNQIQILIWDTFEHSEMASIDNIRSVELVDTNQIRYGIQEYKLSPAHHFVFDERDFFRRGFSMKFMHEIEESIIVEGLAITFINGTEKLFDFGRVLIETIDYFVFMNPHINYYGGLQGLVSRGKTLRENAGEFKTAIIYGTHGIKPGKYVVKSIDLRVENLYIAYEDVLVFNMNDVDLVRDIHYLRNEQADYQNVERARGISHYLREDYYSWLEVTDDVSTDHSLEHITFEITSIQEYVSFLLPLRCQDESVFKDTIIFSPRIVIEDEDGNETVLYTERYILHASKASEVYLRSDFK